MLQCAKETTGRNQNKPYHPCVDTLNYYLSSLIYVNVKARTQRVTIASYSYSFVRYNAPIGFALVNLRSQGAKKRACDGDDKSN